MYAELGLYIDGAWKKTGGGGKSEQVINPATEKPLATLPHASKADLDAALEAAKKGFAAWKATSAYDRCKIMAKAANLMRGRSVGCVVVAREGRVVGIVTVSDLLELIGRDLAVETRRESRPALHHRVPHRKQHRPTGVW